MESSAHSDYCHLFGLATPETNTHTDTCTHTLKLPLKQTHAHTHALTPQIPNYKEQRSVRRCLIKTTDQLTAQLAWLIRGSVGTKAHSPLLSPSLCLSPSLNTMRTCTHTVSLALTHTRTHLSQGLGTG